VGYVQVEYDEEADAIAVHLQEPEGEVITEDFGPGRYVDYDASGAVVGVEFLSVSRGISLEGMPEADRIRRALNAIPHPV
jgi:uncharacterized protein YuzE